ncbi:MAG: hypothetical protein AAF702_03350 [Chloroflexota bacterium]
MINFDKLNEILWGELQHAYGAATGRPQSLRNLASSDNRIRKDADDELSTSIVHQGSVYEAATQKQKQP